MPPSSQFVLPASVVNVAFWAVRAVFIRACWLLHHAVALACGSPRPRELASELGQPDAEGVCYSVNIGSGMPKQPTPRAFVTRLGILGDAQNIGYTKSWGGHGGERKAVMLWSLEVIQHVAAEGHPDCGVGRCGEQITVSGVDWTLFRTGARVAIGSEVLLEVTYLKPPCTQQEPNFRSEVGDGMQRICPTRHPDSSRAHTRVLRGGYVATGDKVAVYRSPLAASGGVVRCAKDPSVCISSEYAQEERGGS